MCYHTPNLALYSPTMWNMYLDVKSRYRLIDDHTSEMAKTIKEEEGRYDCGPDKRHTTSSVLQARPPHPKEKEGA